MNFHARNLSVTLMAAVSGIALSVCLSPAFAQAYDSPERNHVNADGMPTTHSTAAEKADTARINRQVGADNRAVDDRANADNNRYQAEQNRYRDQVQDNRAKVEIGLCRGKKLYDKRETIKEREVQRELARVHKQRVRG